MTERKTLSLIFPDKFVDYVVVPEQVKSSVFIMEPPACIALVEQIKGFQYRDIELS